MDWNLFNLATQGVTALKKLKVSFEEGKTELSAFLRGVADQIDNFDLPDAFGEGIEGYPKKKKSKKAETHADPVGSADVLALENDVAILESDLTGQKSFGGVTVSGPAPEVGGPVIGILFQIGLSVLKALLANKSNPV